MAAPSPPQPLFVAGRRQAGTPGAADTRSRAPPPAQAADPPPPTAPVVLPRPQADRQPTPLPDAAVQARAEPTPSPARMAVAAALRGGAVAADSANRRQDAPGRRAADAAMPAADRPQDDRQQGRPAARPGARALRSSPAGPAPGREEGEELEAPTLAAEPEAGADRLGPMGPVAVPALAALWPVPVTLAGDVLGAHAAGSGGAAAGKRKDGEAPRAEDDPEQRKAADDVARAEAARAYAALVDASRSLQQAFVDSAARVAAAMVDAAGQAGGDVERRHEAALADLDLAAERAHQDVEAAAGEAEAMLEDAFRAANAGLTRASRRAHGSIAANEETAGAQISTILDGLVGGHRKAYDNGIAKAVAAATKAVAELQAWNTGRNTTYPTEGTSALLAAQHESVRLRVPALAADTQKSVTERKDRIVASWTGQRESSVCGLTCQFRPELDKHKQAMHTQGHGAVAKALKNAKDMLERQHREGRQALANLRTSARTQIDVQRGTARTKLTGQARASIEGAQRESQAAVDGVGQATRASLPGYWRGVQGFEQAMRRAGPRGPQEVRKTARDGADPVRRNLELADRGLTQRLADNQRRLETSLERRVQVFDEHGRALLVETGEALSRRALDTAAELGRTGREAAAGFEGHDRAVTQSAESWARPLSQAMAGYISQSRTSAQQSLAAVLAGGQPTSSAARTPSAAPAAAAVAQAQQPADACGGCPSPAEGGGGATAPPAGRPPGGLAVTTGPPGPPAKPKGLTEQIKDEETFSNDRAAPTTFPAFVSELNQIKSRVRGNLDKRAGQARQGLEAGIIDTVDEGVVTGALRGLTQLKGHALDVEIYPSFGRHITLSQDLLLTMRSGTDYQAAIAYLSGNAVEGARLELQASMHWYNDEESRIEATMRALSPEQLQALGRSHAGVLDDVHNALDGTDRQAFDALRAADPAHATAAYAQADAIRLRARIDELRREGNHDAVHAAIVESTAATEEGYGGQEVSAEARRAAVVGALGRLVGTEPVDGLAAMSAEQRAALGDMTAEQRQEAMRAAEQRAYEERAVTYVARDIEVEVGGGGDMPPQTITLKMEGANRDLTRDLMLHGEGSVEARASRLGVELQRSGDTPEARNIDRAMSDERFTPDNPNATPEEREANEGRRRQARADRAQVLLLAAQRYAGERPPPEGATVAADQALQDPRVKSARDALIGRLQTRYGDETLGGQLAQGLLTDERPSPATAAIAMRHAMYTRSGTDEELLFRFTERMNRDEIAAMRTAFYRQTGKSLDAELGVYGRGGTFTELSGDDRLRMERAMLGVARTDQERLEVAAFAINQQRRETGTVGRWLASGSRAEAAMDATYRRLIQSAGGNLQFDRRGNLITPAAFDGRGNYTGTDRATFVAAADAAQQVAQNYSARIDAYANLATTGIMILGAIAGAVITVATGGAAGPLVAAALITGLASMSAQYALKGGRYGWEQAAVDLGMTAVQALTAGVGAQLGAAAQVASKSAQAASQASRVATTLARMFTGNKVLDQIIIGAISGGISGLGTTALNEQTWARGAGGGIGALAEGLLKGMLAGAATSAATNSIEAIGIRGQALGERLQALSAQGPAGRATLNMLMRGGARSIISATGGMTGRSVEILFDAASGRFHGDSGDALVLIGEAGLHSAVQGLGEGMGEAHGQRIHNRREARQLAQAGEKPEAPRPTEAAAPRPAEAEGGARPSATEEPSGVRPPSDAEAAATMAIHAAGGGEPPSPSAPPPAANEAVAAATRAAEAPEAAPRPAEAPEPVRAAAAEAAEASRRSQRVAPSEDSFADAEFDAILHDLRNSEFGFGLEAAKRRAPEPLPEDRTRTRAQVDAAAHGAARRQPPPGRVPGAQIQHNTKTLDVTRNLPAGMHPLDVNVINENLMWLQSRRNLPSTVLHVDPHGGGTRFYIDDVPRGRIGDAGARGEQLDLFQPSPGPRQPDFGTEHKFMDNHLIPAVSQQIAEARARAGLPPLDPRMLAIAAGEQARWMIDGVSGSSRSGEVVDVAAAATARPAAEAQPARPAEPSAQLELPFNRPAAAAEAAGPVRPAAEEAAAPRIRVADEDAPRVRVGTEEEPARVRIAVDEPEATRQRIADHEAADRAAMAEAEAAEPMRARMAGDTGAAARLRGTEMELTGRTVITDEPAALQKALGDLGGLETSLAGMTVHADPGGPGMRVTVPVDGGEPFTVRIVVDDTERGDVASFRPGTKGEGADFVVTLSRQARESAHARAIAHELAEIRSARQGAGTDDVLKPGEPADPATSRLSAHDRGRLAELEVLSGRLRAAEAANAPPAEIARIRHEAELLVSALGLAGSRSAQQARRQLAETALADSPAARSLVGEAAASAAKNPFLSPLRGDLDDMAVLARQAEHGRSIGDPALEARAAALARRLVEEGGFVTPNGDLIAARLKAPRAAMKAAGPEAEALFNRVLGEAQAARQPARQRADALRPLNEAIAEESRTAAAARHADEEAARLERTAKEKEGLATRIEERNPTRAAELRDEAETMRQDATEERARAAELRGKTSDLRERVRVLRETTVDPGAVGSAAVPGTGRTVAAELAGDPLQRELVRQRFGDNEMFQDWGEFLRAYFRSNPSVRRDDPGVEQRLFAEWQRGAYVDTESGRINELKDLRLLKPAAADAIPVHGRLPEELALTIPRRSEGESGETLKEQATLSPSQVAVERKRLLDRRDVIESLLDPDSDASLPAGDPQRPVLESELTRVLADLRDASEALGVAAGRQFAAEQGWPTEVPIPRSGSGVPDLVYRDANGRLVIVECKGPRAKAATRGAELAGEPVRAQQGTPEYLRSLATEMASSSNTEIRDLGLELLAALVPGKENVDYYLVQQTVNDDPGQTLSSIKAQQHDMRTPGR